MNFYETNLNTAVFSSEQVQNGLMTKLLTVLLEQNSTDNTSFNEIRITSDGECQVVNWINHPKNSFFEEGEFVYVSGDELFRRNERSETIDLSNAEV